MVDYHQAHGKNCPASTKIGNGVPDTGAHVQQQHVFVMYNSGNTVEGSDSAAQEIFQPNKRMKPEVWVYFGFYKNAMLEGS